MNSIRTGGASDLLRRVEESLRSRRLVRRGEKMLVAVSGGLDSMTLLRALHRLSEQWRWKIVVAHFNHRLRGHSSDADERFVRRAAATLGLPVVVGRGEVKRLAKKSSVSVEMAARKLRHEFLARAAGQRNIRVIALAHHADDQVELFFLRLLRGTGGEGLSGMKWRSPSPANPHLTLIRPLLDFSKAELRTFARANRIGFREDATNLSPDILRNRVRRGLLPLLRRRYQPGLDRIVLRLMEIAGAEADFVGMTAQNWIVGGGPLAVPKRNRCSAAARLQKSSFENLPVAVQRRILQWRLSREGVLPEFELIESLRRSPGVFVSVNAQRSVARGAAGELQWRAQPAIRFNKRGRRVKLERNAGEVNFDGVSLNWRVEAYRKFSRPLKKTGWEFFDADRIGDEILLRHWRPGDRFQPIGLKSAAKLQDLFTNAKIPRAWRHEAIVAATAGGEVFWVQGLRIGEAFKLTPHTKRRLVWRLQAAR
ncbi:MAG: tRNA lysidine(34) synthetase TilS [Verrucomicrobiota bacterium]|nr:tRNA lysidine(34) synthetase TilS [Verrucomicrobiota bacterium]